VRGQLLGLGGERGVLAPTIALWLPNVILTILAVTFLARAARESDVIHPFRVESWVLALRTRVAQLAGFGTD
jgi:hypothetical protein